MHFYNRNHSKIQEKLCHYSLIIHWKMLMLSSYLSSHILVHIDFFHILALYITEEQYAKKCGLVVFLILEVVVKLFSFKTLVLWETVVSRMSWNTVVEETDFIFSFEERCCSSFFILFDFFRLIPSGNRYALWLLSF